VPSWRGYLLQRAHDSKADRGLVHTDVGRLTRFATVLRRRQSQQSPPDGFAGSTRLSGESSFGSSADLAVTAR
jgi:hypothetical protein